MAMLAFCPQDPVVSCGKYLPLGRINEMLFLVSDRVLVAFAEKLRLDLRRESQDGGDLVFFPFA
jgi:hypothetical protein